MPGVGRFRVNVLRQRSSFMVVMRVIPFDVPTLEGLALPDVLAHIAESDRGLVIVTGVTGSGKTSTIAAMINHINRNRHKHIVTIENPIEFLHRDVNCSVTQREVGVDTESFGVGLSSALRQDPDVVVIGEMRDAETLDTAIKGAEMGHLVIAAMPSPDVVSTLNRMLAMFPREERQIGRLRLADTLRAVISQQLISRKDDSGRVAAMEVLVATPDVREAIREAQGIEEIPEIMAQANDVGMRSLEQHLSELAESGAISAETARAALADPDTPPVLAETKGRKKVRS
jgi:twitching motility protein PilT